jgi:hypothetical protein
VAKNGILVPALVLKRENLAAGIAPSGGFAQIPQQLKIAGKETGGNRADERGENPGVQRQAFLECLLLKLLGFAIKPPAKQLFQ